MMDFISICIIILLTISFLYVLFTITDYLDRKRTNAVLGIIIMTALTSGFFVFIVPASIRLLRLIGGK
jgi:hypothetical protein